MRAPAAALAILGLLAAAPGPAPAPPVAAQEAAVAEPGAIRADDAPWSPDEEERRIAAEMLRLLNEERRDRGVVPLRPAPGLDRVAYQHATEMARRGRVTHHSHWWGLGTARRLRLAFPLLSQFAENVARNRDAASLHEALMGSTGHRMNRLDPAFTHVGMGAVRTGDYEVYATEIFVRASRDAQVSRERLAVLYTTTPPGRLEPDEPVTGEVTGQSLRLGPPGEDDPEFWTRRGIDLMDGGRPGEAVRAFRRALEIAPDYDYARYDLARALLRADRPGEAREQILRYLGEHPDDTDARATLVTAELLLGHYAAAEAAVRRVLEDRPRDAGAWYNLGLSLEYQDRPTLAADAYRQALNIDPALGPALAGLERVSG